MTDADNEGRFKATTIGHADRAFLGPLSEAKADRLIDWLAPSAGGRIADVGCGKAAFLIRLLNRYPEVSAIGIDINPTFLAQAATAAKRAGIVDRLELVGEAAEMVVQRIAPLDVLLCMGATQAFGGLDATTRVAQEALSSGALLLIGEGYWRAEPDDEYLKVLGAERDELSTHAQNAERIVAAGFQLLATAAASKDEWDAYEGAYLASKTRWASANPDDADAAEILARAQDWHHAYLKFGRATLGFGWYLAQRL